MRERLIPHSFYIIFSEDSDFEVEKWGKLYAELKEGVQQNPKKYQKIQKCQKMEYGRWARRCATVRKQFYPGEKGRDGARIDKMPFWGLRNSLSAGKYMYHEENLRPDSILKSRSHLKFRNGPFLLHILWSMFKIWEVVGAWERARNLLWTKRFQKQ